MSDRTEYFPDGKIVTVRELLLGDVCRMLHGEIREPQPWSTCVVVQIDASYVHFFRPYGHVSDFSYTAGLIPYVGTERYKVELESSCPYLLLERPPTPK